MLIVTKCHQLVTKVFGDSLGTAPREPKRAEERATSPLLLRRKVIEEEK